MNKADQCRPNKNKWENQDQNKHNGPNRNKLDRIRLKGAELDQIRTNGQNRTKVGHNGPNRNKFNRTDQFGPY